MRVLKIIIIILLLISFYQQSNKVPNFTDELNSIICMQEGI